MDEKEAYPRRWPMPAVMDVGGEFSAKDAVEPSKLLSSLPEAERKEVLDDIVKASQTATTGGRKFDGGKSRYGLLPPLALEENVRVLTVGAEKYEPDNWRRVPDGPRRYFDAAQRHLWAYKRGEKRDPETGLHHLAHALCCIQFILDLDLAAEQQETK